MRINMTQFVGRSAWLGRSVAGLTARLGSTPTGARGRATTRTGSPLGAIVAHAFLFLGLFSAALADAQTRRPPGPEVVYRMQIGDNPWDITERYLRGFEYWQRIVRLNGFADSTRLPPGTRVRIPQAWLQREPVPVTVLTTFDEVMLVAADGVRRVGKPGSVLKPGERLVTSAIGSATLGVENGSRILVRPGTHLALAEASRPIDLPDSVAPDESSGLSPVALQFQLLRGAIESAVRRINSSGRFEIETPAAVAAVRGTNLRVSAEGDATTTGLTSGALALLNDRGRVELTRDEGTRVVQGRRPEPPTPLLAAPDLSPLPQVITRTPIDLPLPLIDGAVAYRAEFTPQPSAAPVSDVVSKGPRVRARDLDNGQYRLSVRAVDRRGIEGLDTETIVRVHTHPTPPVQIEPAADARIGADMPTFRWSEAADANQRQVRLQVAPTADFAAPLVDLTMVDAGTAHPEQALVPGPYFWRLLAINATDGPGPWSDPQPFTRILPAPGVEAPDVDGEHLNLRWPAVPGAGRYQVQIATDGEFNTPLVDESVEDHGFAMDRPKAGVYFFRVQAIAADGEAGSFNKAEKFTVEEPVNPWYFLWLLAPLLLAL